MLCELPEPTFDPANSDFISIGPFSMGGKANSDEGNALLDALCKLRRALIDSMAEGAPAPEGEEEFRRNALIADHARRWTADYVRPPL